MNEPALPARLIAHALMASGAFIMFFGVVGMIILDDLFQRVHASTKCGVSGAIAVLLGLSVWSGQIDFILKFAVILFFLLFTAPIIAHMLAISRLGEESGEEDDDA